MKKLIFMLIIALFLFGCSPEATVEEPPKEMHDSKDMDANDHIGCQENEIDENGDCLPAENKNSQLFAPVDNVKTQTIDLGYVAEPMLEGNYPGVVMIHEWWGLNDEVKNMAEQLASEGYVVLAVDIYKGEVAQDSDKARELATYARTNTNETIATMKAAANYLRERQVTSLGSMGWCFGGQQSLLLSLNEELNATVIYYGHLIDDKEQLSSINSPVLGIFGAEDSSISVKSVNSFESALNELGIENDITIYDGVGHAFANPSGSNYAENETRDAWKKTIDFLDANLREQEVSQPDIEFEIEGSNFKFAMDGRDAPELVVNEGDLVRVTFTSVGGFHDFVIDELEVGSQAVKEGETTVFEFIANQKGEFEYYCSIGRHRENGMFGKIIVN